MSKMWNHFKNNQLVMKYILEYSEREYFYNILKTYHHVDLSYLIKAVYKTSKT